MLIEQSIAKQYHILPSEQGNLSYSDWAKLVSGLMNDTPLGKIIEIRSETDRDIIQNMTSEQLSVRNAWEAFKREHTHYTETDMQRQAEYLENMIRSMFG